MSCKYGHEWTDARGHCVLCKGVHIPADQAWRNFDYTFKPGYTRTIHSKRQFLAECKKTGKVWTTADDLVRKGQPYNQPAMPDLSKEIHTTVQQVMRQATPAKIEAVWRRKQSARSARAPSAAGSVTTGN